MTGFALSDEPEKLLIKMPLSRKNAGKGRFRLQSRGKKDKQKGYAECSKEHWHSPVF